MKTILFIYDHPYPEYWMDGLWAALKHLGQEYKIIKCNLANKDKFVKTDFILGWGSFGSNVDLIMRELKGKKGLCIGGMGQPYNLKFYDALFYETKWQRNNTDIKLHHNINQAFGTNTDIFNQVDIPMPIVWDYIGVGAFAQWKRWHRMISKRGRKLVIGQYQIDNEVESLSIVTDLVRSNVMVSDTVHPLDLANFYHWSRCAYIPAELHGGGERSVLEARACGIDVEVEDDNPKLQEVKDWEPIPDHKWYAKQLKRGIEAV